MIYLQQDTVESELQKNWERVCRPEFRQRRVLRERFAMTFAPSHAV